MSLILDCFMLWVFANWESVATVTVIPYEFVADFIIVDEGCLEGGLFFRFGSSQNELLLTVENGVLKSSSSFNSLSFGGLINLRLPFFLE